MPVKNKVLVVEDEKSISNFIVAILNAIYNDNEFVQKPYEKNVDTDMKFYPRIVFTDDIEKALSDFVEENEDRVLTEEELQYYNRSLLQILEYYILLELGFTDSKAIKKKITERWGRVSQDLEILRISRAKSTSS